MYFRIIQIINNNYRLRSVRVDPDVDPGRPPTVWLAISVVGHGILSSGRGHDQVGVAAQPHLSPEDQFPHVRATVSAQKIRPGRRKRRDGHFVYGLCLFKVSRLFHYYTGAFDSRSHLTF